MVREEVGASARFDLVPNARLPPATVLRVSHRATQFVLETATGERGPLKEGSHSPLMPCPANTQYKEGTWGDIHRPEVHSPLTPHPSPLYLDSRRIIVELAPNAVVEFEQRRSDSV